MSKGGRRQDTGPSIVIVPTTTAYELEPLHKDKAGRKRRAVQDDCLSSQDRKLVCVRWAGGLPNNPLLLLSNCQRQLAGVSKVVKGAASQQQSNPPRNYLMSGGYRAKDKDEQLLQLNRAAMKACVIASAHVALARQSADSCGHVQDLRNANSALANELARTRSACQEVCQTLFVCICACTICCNKGQATSLGCRAAGPGCYASGFGNICLRFEGRARPRSKLPCPNYTCHKPHPPYITACCVTGRVIFVFPG